MLIQDALDGSKMVEALYIQNFETGMQVSPAHNSAFLLENTAFPCYAAACTLRQCHS